MKCNGLEGIVIISFTNPLCHFSVTMKDGIVTLSQWNEKGKHMKITTNMDVNKQIGAAYVSENKPAAEKEKPDVTEKAVEVSLSTEQSGRAVLSDEELQCALENLLVSQNSVYDVWQAEQMIAQANKNILENANESILAQANQTPAMVTELT